MKIHELLSDESKWTKYALARNRSGLRTASTSYQAVCWCLMGAITKCYGVDDYKYFSAMRRLDARVGNIPAYNDNPHTTFADVQRLVKELDI